MKAQILKHTGLTEKQFYAKYNTPEDFFNSKEGKAFNKAQNGYMGTGSVPRKFGSGLRSQAITNFGPQNAPPIVPFQEGYDPYASNIAKPKLPTDPSQEEMDSAYSLVKPYKKGEAQAEGINAVQQAIGVGEPLGNETSTQSAQTPFGVSDAIGLGSSLFGAGQAFFDQRKKRKEADMWKNVTGLQLKASRTKPEGYDRMYDRPEDNTITGEELFPIHGVGTNPIAQDGSMIPGNPGEIQNTFAPNDIYTDMGYEPLNDLPIKQYQMGGQIVDALSGPTNSFIGSQMDNNAGYQMGNAIGSAAKFIPGIGPIASAVASPVLGFVGGQLDKVFGDAGKIAKARAATDRNVMSMGLANQFQANRDTAVSQNGGFTPSHGNPQVISHYGKYSMKELLKPDPMMDTLQDGGELQTHWGGGYEPMSQNPYLPAGGQSIMFRGNSHHDSDGKGNTGIGITYGNNPVEVEGGEPAQVLQDGGGEENMVVFGNLPINKQNAGLIGDSKAVNKRFKNYVADLNKQENKHTKTLDKNTKDLNDLKVYDPFDKLELASYQANMLGSNMSLKSIADKKQKASHLQNAINETRDEISDALGYTVSAEQLAKNGQIVKDKDPVTKMAKWGAVIEKAQSGTKKKSKITFKGNIGPVSYKHQSKNPEGLPYTKIGEDPNQTMFASEEAYANYLSKINKAYEDPEKKRALVEYFKNYEGPGWENVRGSLNKGKTFEEQAAIAKKLGTDRLPGPFHVNPEQFDIPADIPAPAATVKEEIPIEAKGDNWWNLLGAALPYIRPSNAGYLDPNQLLGETYAMSTNQVEPVQAIGYQPQLRVPYDISLQDQLNQVTSQTRAAQRMSGYNPAAQSQIAAQSYAPANQILGEQFRANQAMKDQVYSGNIATLNDAKLKNLGIFDQQAQRQSQALSNTKAINQAALNSISSKYQQNALENKTLQTYENLYNYRYGPGMRAYNLNAPAQFNMPLVYQEGEDYTANAAKSNLTPVYDKEGNFQGYKEPTVAKKETKSKETKATRNGSIVSALKRM